MATAQLGSPNASSPNTAPPLHQLQCPNPTCGSGQISRKVVELAYNEVYHLKDSYIKWRQALVRSIVLLPFYAWFIYMLVGSRLGLFETFLVIFAAAAIVLGAAYYGYNLSYTKAQKLRMMKCRCRACSYKWEIRLVEPESNLRYKQWALDAYNSIPPTALERKIRPLSELAQAEVECVNYPQALYYSQQCMSLIGHYAGGNRPYIKVLLALTQAQLGMGQYQDISANLHKLQRLCQMHRDWYSSALTRHLEGLYYLLESNNTQAKTCLVEGLIAASKTGDMRNAVNGLAAMAYLAAIDHKPVVAAQLHGAVEAVCYHNMISVPHYLRPFYDKSLAIMQTELDSSVGAIAWQQGRSLSWGQAVRLAVSNC